MFAVPVLVVNVHGEVVVLFSTVDWIQPGITAEIRRYAFSVLFRCLVSEPLGLLEGIERLESLEILVGVMADEISIVLERTLFKAFEFGLEPAKRCELVTEDAFKMLERIMVLVFAQRETRGERIVREICLIVVFEMPAGSRVFVRMGTERDTVFVELAYASSVVEDTVALSLHSFADFSPSPARGDVLPGLFDDGLDFLFHVRVLCGPLGREIIGDGDALEFFRLYFSFDDVPDAVHGDGVIVTEEAIDFVIIGRRVLVETPLDFVLLDVFVSSSRADELVTVLLENLMSLFRFPYSVSMKR